MEFYLCLRESINKTKSSVDWKSAKTKQSFSLIETINAIKKYWYRNFFSSRLLKHLEIIKKATTKTLFLFIFSVRNLEKKDSWKSFTKYFFAILVF